MGGQRVVSVGVRESERQRDIYDAREQEKGELDFAPCLIINFWFFYFISENVDPQIHTSCRYGGEGGVWSEGNV